ncbi:hypothetical protein JTB14_004618 [Gonioctena quinquepunctata]|nr:hypothetical protein JTB14_004618 [Gonioctena quinquepunctata]
MQHTIINENQFSQNQPILLPAMEEFGMEPYTPSISLQLEDMDLDELQSIKTAFRQDQPEIFFLEVAHIPSFWTLSIYAILISTTMYILYTKISPKFCKTKTPRDQNAEIEMSRVQLPH